MTLCNMRQKGVRGLFVACTACCGYTPEVNVDAWPDGVPVRSFGPCMRCGRRGNLDATARPNWIEPADRLPGGARDKPGETLPQLALREASAWLEDFRERRPVAREALR
jgi:hypothetical protein